MGKKGLVVAGIGLIGATLALVVGYGQRRWGGRERFTLVTPQGQIQVASFDPQTEEGIRLVLPPDLEIETVGGRGKWRVEVLSQVGPALWAADSIADSLGIAYTGVAHQLTWWDRWSWWRWSRQVRWRQVELGQTQLVSKSKTPDGEEVTRLNAAWELAGREWFSSLSLAGLDVAVAVVNATDTPGLGAHASRLIENSGLKVIKVVTETDPHLDRCQVTGPALPGRYLERVFDCDWSEAGGEVVVRLGLAYRRWWLGD